uniref:ATP synthase subunit a n=1 Tax=Phyllodiaptomus tunguidus TaxID=2690417 RepID=A0A8K1KXX1_9MAXI|nr:ATP synthase subunit 6 [Phyllodiaptomus tunguidus]
MGNLFSSFDPQASVLFFSGGLNWVSTLSAAIIFPQVFWLTKNQFSGSLMTIFKALLAELSAVFGGLCVPGVSMIFLSFFFFIIFSNFLGLFPYVFTASSHLVFTLALSLPIWLGTMIWSIFFQFKNIMAHLVPLGTPGALMPVMVLIETVSSIIRPMTLGIRLAANMIAGHLLLTLLGGQGSFSLSGSIVLLALAALITLECAVACIQSYVFTILSSLYLSELMSAEFSKKFA